MNKVIAGLLLLTVITPPALFAQGIRDRTRPTFERDTAVSADQAQELTLTLVETGSQVLQTWVRTAGRIDADRKVLTARVCTEEQTLVKPRQRVRAFPPDSKSSIYQARVRRVERDGDCSLIHADLSGPTYEDNAFYVMEIITLRGSMLAIPNEAIIEEGEGPVVYKEMREGSYMPHPIQTGIRGESYTQILAGLNDGDRVVTFGSFFIDADYKLKNDPAMMAAMHAGMDMGGAGAKEMDMSGMDMDETNESQVTPEHDMGDMSMEELPASEVDHSQMQHAQ